MFPPQAGLAWKKSFLHSVGVNPSICTTSHILCVIYTCIYSLSSTTLSNKVQHCSCLYRLHFDVFNNKESHEAQVIKKDYVSDVDTAQAENTVITRLNT